MFRKECAMTLIISPTNAKISKNILKKCPFAQRVSQEMMRAKE
jgi:hypothetical protein